MARRIAQSTLNASTVDILNTIRQNASAEYQSSVPSITEYDEIPKVGEVIYGNPAFANQFISTLVNRIAAVRVQSATFNNPYSILKKGYIEFGETIEDIFVNIAKVVDYKAEKGADRELSRNLPDIKAAFHACNWRVMYPVTIEDEELKQAFLSVDGVTDLISKIVDQIYTAAEYDEFLLFKYLLIKAAAHGKMAPVTLGSDDTASAKAFRGTSNLLPFMSSTYNEASVKTCTPKDRQVIFMDAAYNAAYDVDILASAFNMDKADFMGRLFLIDNWTTFDNDRFATIRANSDGLEEVTSAELSAMASVKAILLDENWFQVYDNNNKFTEKYVASGLYWNYFYHCWKTISVSPFANAVCFLANGTSTTAPASYTATVVAKDQSADAIVITLSIDDSSASVIPSSPNYIQTQAMVTNGIAMYPYGAIACPTAKKTTDITLKATMAGASYTASAAVKCNTLAVGSTITMAKDA